MIDILVGVVSPDIGKKSIIKLVRKGDRNGQSEMAVHFCDTGEVIILYL